MGKHNLVKGLTKAMRDIGEMRRVIGFESY